MALRSSLAAVRAAASAPLPTPTDGRDEAPESSVPPTAVPIAAVSPGPGRGRPAGAKDAAPRKPRAAAVKATVEAAVGASAKELRQALKDVENEAAEVKAAVAAATAKLQPKIDALRARHADLSKQLAELMFK